MKWRTFAQFEIRNYPSAECDMEPVMETTAVETLRAGVGVGVIVGLGVGVGAGVGVGDVLEPYRSETASVNALKWGILTF